MCVEVFGKVAGYEAVDFLAAECNLLGCVGMVAPEGMIHRLCKMGYHPVLVNITFPQVQNAISIFCIHAHFTCSFYLSAVYFVVSEHERAYINKF